MINIDTKKIVVPNESIFDSQTRLSNELLEALFIINTAVDMPNDEFNNNRMKEFLNKYKKDNE